MNRHNAQVNIRMYSRVGGDKNLVARLFISIENRKWNDHARHEEKRLTRERKSSQTFEENRKWKTENGKWKRGSAPRPRHQYVLNVHAQCVDYILSAANARSWAEHTTTKLAEKIRRKEGAAQWMRLPE